MKVSTGLCALVMVFASACEAPASTAIDAGSLDADAGFDDGAPVRAACTSSYGDALGDGYGRLDGYLVSIVAPGHHGCNGDDSHIHLQVRASGSIYDIAITATDTDTTPVDFTTRDLPLPDGAWAEGWHSGVMLDYVALGLHAADFPPVPKPMLTAMVDADLATANHVSVFATSYTDHSGAHLVHRNGDGNDGALVVRPTAETARLLLFHFVSQSF